MRDTFGGMGSRFDATGWQPIVVAATSAALGACLTRQFGWIGAGVVSTLAILAWHSGHRRPLPVRAVLWAVPAALAALPAWTSPREPLARTGPVRFDATVFEVRDRAGVRQLWCRAHRVEFVCLVDGQLPRRPLVGDRLRGIGRWSAAEAPARSRLAVHADGCQLIGRARPSTRWLASTRATILDSIQNHVDGAPGHLLGHLVLNTGPPLPEALHSAHRATGLAHLLAVSGAHASILGALLAMVVARGGRSPVHHRFFRWFGTAFLSVYGILTGLEPPVVRAVLMFVAVVWAQSRGRRLGLGTALAFPTLVTAVFAPTDLFSVSFCLSYAAVFGLGLSGAFGGERWVTRFVWVPLRASLWATLTTTPLTLLYFGQLAPWTILATPVLGPLIGLLLAGGLLLPPADWSLPLVADWLGEALGWLAHLYATAVLALDHAPATPVQAVTVPSATGAVAAVCFALAALCWWRSRRGVAVACIALCVPHFVPRSAEHDRLALLSVGHGQAAVVEAASGPVTVIDCGSGGRPQRAARQVVAALRRRRVIDRLIVTHGDADHAGGVMQLARTLPVVELIGPSEWLAGPVGTRAARLVEHAIALAPGDRLEPAPGWVLVRPAQPASRNDGSIWIRMPLGAGQAVLPADALGPAITQLLAQPNARDVVAPAELLLLPHHGRPLAAVDPLLDAIRPGLALASNGRSDTPCAQARSCARRGIPVLETGRRGTIEIHAARFPTDAAWVVQAEHPLRIDTRAASGETASRLRSRAESPSSRRPK